MSDRWTMNRRDALFSLLLPALGAGLASIPSVAASPTGGNSPNLVAYLSRSGNTRVVAGQLKHAFRADLFEIRTVEPYPEDYEETVDLANRQRQAGATPRLAENVTAMARYDTVFLGFPIWGRDLPAPARTFLATHDLSGKTLVPFITYGSSGPGRAPRTVAELASGARIVAPFALKCDQERDTLKSVSTWLRTLEPEL